jgi:hypothetical protein
MFLSAHLLVGMSIGAAMGNPYIAAPAGFVSHYIVDALPHFEGSSFREAGDRAEGFKNWVEWFFVILDLSFVVFILIYFKKWWHPAPLIGGFFAMLPDLVDHVPFWNKFFRKTKLFKFLHDKIHAKIHWTTYGKWIPLGILIDALAIGGCLWFLIR